MIHMRTLDRDRLPVSMPEGRLAVLRRDGPGGNASVVLRLRQRADFAGMLVGRPAAEAPRQTRRLLPVDGWGQQLACLSAIEAATGRIPDPAVARARALLAQAELAVGLIARACVDWPRLLGSEPQLRHLRYARTALDALIARLWRGADPIDPTALAAPPGEAELAISALIEAIETTVLPGAPADPAHLADWAAHASAPLARLTRAAAGVRLAARIPALGALPGLPALAAAMARDPDFGRAPHRAGAAGDPTPYARMPAVADAARFGPVGARLLARAALAQATVEGLARLDPPAIQLDAPAPGTGAALVEGVHGPHVHLVRCDRRALVAAFGSVAPAEWLLHPSRPLAATLASLPRHRFLQDAPLVLAAYDPCGAYELRHERAVGA